MECSRCGSEEFRKHTKRKNKNSDESIQRFKCKKCGKTQSEHKVTYTEAEKRLLSFLINFLENDLENLNTKDFLKKSKEYRCDTSNISIEKCKKTKTIDFGSRGAYFSAYCIKPRLIICEDEGKIEIVKFPKDVTDKYKRHFRCSFNV